MEKESASGHRLPRGDLKRKISAGDVAWVAKGLNPLSTGDWLAGKIGKALGKTQGGGICTCRTTWSRD